MATAKKLPSGSWRCLVYDYTDANGKRKYKSITNDDPSPAGKRMCERDAAEYAALKAQLRSNNSSLTISKTIIIKLRRCAHGCRKTVRTAASVWNRSIRESRPRTWEARRLVHFRRRPGGNWRVMILVFSL